MEVIKNQHKVVTSNRSEIHSKKLTSSSPKNKNADKLLSLFYDNLNNKFLNYEIKTFDPLVVEIKSNSTNNHNNIYKNTTMTTIEPFFITPPPSISFQSSFDSNNLIPTKQSAQIRCYGCRNPSSDCTVPCRYPQKCFIRAPNPNSTCEKNDIL